MAVLVLTFQPPDLDELTRITIEAFEHIAVDRMIENQFGTLNGHDWSWRKARSIEDDVSANAEGVFVAEDAGKILGYITASIDRASGFQTWL